MFVIFDVGINLLKDEIPVLVGLDLEGVGCIVADRLANVVATKVDLAKASDP
jgi:hypothetical protein